MSEDKGYNGWTNYETWRVNLEFFDGDHWNERAEEIAQQMIDDGENVSDLAISLADEMSASMEDFIYENSKPGLVQDYAMAFISNVNYYEIAQHYTDDIKVYVAEWHFPGCMPECAPAYFLDEEQARNYLAEEMERGEDELSEEDEQDLNNAINLVRETGFAHWRNMNWCVEEVK